MYVIWAVLCYVLRVDGTAILLQATSNCITHSVLALFGCLVKLTLVRVVIKHARIQILKITVMT